MFNYVKNSLSKLIKSRLIVLVVLFALLAGILIQRLYTMQIINGEKYLTDFTMQIKKETTLKSTRGNIYDRDGNAVAYNKLAYNVTYEDVGSYDTTRERNLAMNGSLYQIDLASGSCQTLAVTRFIPTMRSTLEVTASMSLQGKALIFCVSGQIFSDTQIRKI